MISLVSSTAVKKSSRDLKDPGVLPFEMFNLHIIKGLNSSWIRAVCVVGIRILHPPWAGGESLFLAFRFWEPLGESACTQKEEAHKLGTNWLSSHGPSYRSGRGSKEGHRTCLTVSVFPTLSHPYSLLLQGLNYSVLPNGFLTSYFSTQKNVNPTETTFKYLIHKD